MVGCGLYVCLSIICAAAANTWAKPKCAWSPPSAVIQSQMLAGGPTNTPEYPSVPREGSQAPVSVRSGHRQEQSGHLRLNQSLALSRQKSRGAFWLRVSERSFSKSRMDLSPSSMDNSIAEKQASSKGSNFVDVSSDPAWQIASAVAAAHTWLAAYSRRTRGNR